MECGESHCSWDQKLLRYWINYAHRTLLPTRSMAKKEDDWFSPQVFGQSGIKISQVDNGDREGKKGVPV